MNGGVVGGGVGAKGCKEGVVCADSGVLLRIIVSARLVLLYTPRAGDGASESGVFRLTPLLGVASGAWATARSRRIPCQSFFKDL